MSDLSAVLANGAMQANPYAQAANFATGLASGGPSSAASDIGAVNFSNPFSGGNATFGPVNIGSTTTPPASSLNLAILAIGAVGVALMLRRR